MPLNNSGGGGLLYWFGAGPVKGFAVTLSLGVIASLISALLVVRLLTITWLRRSRGSARWCRISKNAEPTSRHCPSAEELRARPQIIESTFDRVRYGVYNRAEYRMLWG